MDIVYVLGRGSHFHNLELRYSLRSLEKFITNFSTVYVVGERPDWLSEHAIHLPYPDRWACKERNIMEKIELACHLPQVSERFLQVHDDYFALQPCEAGEVKSYASGTLEALAGQIAAANTYRRSVENTAQVLKERGLSTHHFDIHVPFSYEKQKFVEAMYRYDWEKPAGYVVTSLYANTVGIPPVPLRDVKLQNPYLPLRGVVDILRGRPWWSVGNRGLTPEVRTLLQELYPTPSRFER